MGKQPQIMRRDLVRVLTEASLFIGPPDLPMINAVRLEATGTHLIAIGTDRFSMGVSSAEYEGAPFAITLPMANVKLVLAACKLKTGRRLHPPADTVDLRVTPKGTLLHVTISDTVVTVPTYLGEFPNWRKFLGSIGDIERVAGTFAINPQYSARFGKIGPRADFYLRGPDKAVAVRVGDNFIGLVMPIRMPDGGWPKAWKLPEWLENNAPPTEAAAS